MLSRLSRFGLALPRFFAVPPARFVSQSKPSGSAGSTAVTELYGPRQAPDHEEVNPYLKNPDYNGFSDDPEQDVWEMRLAFFMGISVCLVIGSTFVHYLPDPKMQQWSRREAERLIVLREKEGLPLINENYYDPSTIILPDPEDE
ncbi:NADH dehydrogenase [ubiquinone] 1 beta subcomplex subunit 11, mitochondrial [Austrofundulus limnaeus]|uniref:NADH dehydrogenase [ubiquinone] 1 beta subcomplex subunit 11, mitochondrial n=1 Tax=Austrofundulus limnaeus TaxID=52670 RepID=A0A2I4CJN7_AUSLI|nr:PREDICTED: NADH dehydrogenase [ubiquinone] 1 beta subcomplex subunit 11, mitochondrial [Austrofundulus limnaeus]